MTKLRSGKVFAEQNDETLLIVLIEDIRAVDNLAEIVKVDHIDMFLVARTDLGQSMGIIEPGHPDVNAIERQAIEQRAHCGNGGLRRHGRLLPRNRR